jgi:hypothetical protein
MSLPSNWPDCILAIVVRLAKEGGKKGEAERCERWSAASVCLVKRTGLFPTLPPRLVVN